MPFNFLQSSKLAKLCYPVAASMLLFAPGCGHDHRCNSCTSCTSVASDSPTYAAYESQPQYVAPAQPIYVAPPSNTYADAGIRGPRSQAELDAIYRSALINPVPPMPPRSAPIPQAPQQPSVVIVAPGEGGWNVPISREWHHIVIHHSASQTGSAASFDRAHRDKGWDGLGYHFVIGNGSGSGDGQVEVGYRWTKQMQGAHAGNYEYNQHGIGICLVGDFEHGGPPSPQQMASLRTLVSFLEAKTSIPPSEIVGHGNVPGRNTECPGRNFDMAAFRSSVGGAYLQRSNAATPIEKSPKSPLIRATAEAKIDSKPSVVRAVATP